MRYPLFCRTQAPTPCVDWVTAAGLPGPIDVTDAVTPAALEQNAESRAWSTNFGNPVASGRAGTCNMHRQEREGSMRRLHALTALMVGQPQLGRRLSVAGAR